jgi:hypothetical protein
MTPLDWFLAILSALAALLGWYELWLDGVEPKRTAARMREQLGIQAIEPVEHARLVE